MYLCYIDESGTPEVPGNTSHFILCGLGLPVWHWRDVEREVTFSLKPFGLENEEFHTAWLMRPYFEQSRIKNFAAMHWDQRRVACERERNTYLLKLQRSKNRILYAQVKKNYKKTAPYIHLTFDERKAAVKKIAETIAGWGFVRIFGECIDKLYFNPAKQGRTVAEQGFEQVVSRFEQYVVHQPALPGGQKPHALLVHDRNDTVALHHTKMMRDFHKKGTLWTQVKHIVETPFFVDSSLTRMVQMADVCAWALRRYCENGETDLFNEVFKRADRKGAHAVGVRHFSVMTCTCEICKNH